LFVKYNRVLVRGAPRANNRMLDVRRANGAVSHRDDLDGGGIARGVGRHGTSRATSCVVRCAQSTEHRPLFRSTVMKRSTCCKENIRQILCSMYHEFLNRGYVTLSLESIMLLRVAR